jgi:two-component system chemotaxis sensor kinase CheA
VAGTHPDEFADLLPDYVAECDEHLTAARRVLLALEPAPDRATPDQLDQLFRDFHTIKGLSGMVGAKGAERLAHDLESYLGTVRKGRAALTPAGLDVLVDGTELLEGIVTALRDGAPPPAVDAVAARAAALLPDRPEPEHQPVRPSPRPTALSPDKQARLGAAAGEGGRAWRVTFSPSPEASARGLTVDAVRTRLRAAGEIVHAEPTVGGGGVTFAFLVVSGAPDFAAEFVADGLGVEPYSPPAPAPAERPRTAATLTPSNLVRVDLARLDDLMRTIGELVITRARMDNGLGRIAGAIPGREWRELEETSRAMERHLRDLREGVMRVRLVPVRDVFVRMRFVARDIARDAGREVDLVPTGEATEVDKFVVERLADPLLHLVRNAVSHGLEPPAERVAAGKPARGRIDLRAAAAGGAIVVEVEDDGRGVDPDEVFARARAIGLVPPDAPTDPAAVLDLLCTPGFSTRETADRASGRGVGMDVVRRAVEDLGGELVLHTRPGRGTRFTAHLPLTLAIADALIVVVGDLTYAVPQTAVREIVQVEPGAAVGLENNELLRHRGGVVPLLRLADLFGAARPPGAFPALVVGDGGQAVALAADRVIGLREVVVYPLADPLVQVPGLSGATELGDGRPVLILDTAGLVRHARTRRATPGG